MIDILNNPGGVKPTAGLRQAPGDTAGPAAERRAVMASDSCRLTDLARMWAVTGDDRRALVLTAGWSGRWVTTWKVAGREVTCPAAGMGGFPVPGCGPVRHFTWRTHQGHRPGLQSMTATGRPARVREPCRAAAAAGPGFPGRARGGLAAAPDAVRVGGGAAGAHSRFPGRHRRGHVAGGCASCGPDRGGRPGQVRRLGRGGAGLRVAVRGGGRLEAARDDHAGYAVGAAAAAERPAWPDRGAARRGRRRPGAVRSPVAAAC